MTTLLRSALGLLLALVLTGGAALAVAARQETATAEAEAPTKLNLNEATEEEFAAIPGMGERMIGEFFEYRPYVSILQFREEIGKYVDEEQVAEYEKYVFVPVEPNDADADTLKQLPGVDDDVAEALIAGRPYDSGDAFLDALGAEVTPEEVEVARAYVPTASQASGTPGAEAEAEAPTKLNLNEATEEEFASIPGMGERMIGEFFEYRPYVSIRQFREEIGKYVDESEVAEYEKYVFVPVEPNDADADTLKQIPGVDDDVAGALIASRPYDSADAFLAVLEEQGLSSEEVETAGTYLAADA